MSIAATQPGADVRDADLRRHLDAHAKRVAGLLDHEHDSEVCAVLAVHADLLLRSAGRVERLCAAANLVPARPPDALAREIVLAQLAVFAARWLPPCSDKAATEVLRWQVRSLSRIEAAAAPITSELASETAPAVLLERVVAVAALVPSISRLAPAELSERLRAEAVRELAAAAAAPTAPQRRRSSRMRALATCVAADASAAHGTRLRGLESLLAAHGAQFVRRREALLEAELADEAMRFRAHARVARAIIVGYPIVLAARSRLDHHGDPAEGAIDDESVVDAIAAHVHPLSLPFTAAAIEDAFLGGARDEQGAAVAAFTDELMETLAAIALRQLTFDKRVLVLAAEHEIAADPDRLRALSAYARALRKPVSDGALTGLLRAEAARLDEGGDRVAGDGGCPARTAALVRGLCGRWGVIERARRRAHDRWGTDARAIDEDALATQLVRGCAATEWRLDDAPLALEAALVADAVALLAPERVVPVAGATSRRAPASPSRLDDVLREQLIPLARRRTRMWLGEIHGGVDDAVLVTELLDMVADRPELHAIGEAAAAALVRACRRPREDDDPALVDAIDELRRGAEHRLRGALVDLLEHRYRVLDVAAAACSVHRIAGCEAQVAYCLAVLCQKADPERTRKRGDVVESRRTYELDVGSAGFPRQLRAWADRIAAHIRRSGDLYDEIAAGWHTPDRLARACASERGGGDDQGPEGPLEEVMCRILDREGHGSAQHAYASTKALELMADKLAFAVPRRRMTLQRARDEEPGGADYVFASSLGTWIATATKRDAGRVHDALDPAPGADRAAALVELIGGGATPEEVLAAREVERVDICDAWVAAIERLGTARHSTLDELVEQARRAAQPPSRPVGGEADRVALVVLRALMAQVLAELDDERAAFPELLTYLLLGMRGRGGITRQQLVAVMSLRRASLPRRVIAAIGSQVAHVLVNSAPELVAVARKTAGATPPAGCLAAGRARGILLLLGAPGASRRRDAVNAMAEVLAGLPGSFADDEQIAAHVGAAIGGPQPSANAVRQHRSAARNELACIDGCYDRAFRRYAVRS